MTLPTLLTAVEAVAATAARVDDCTATMLDFADKARALPWPAILAAVKVANEATRLGTNHSPLRYAVADLIGTLEETPCDP